MSREWKPGDVAWIRVGTGDWEIGLFQDDQTWACAHTRPRKEHEDVQVSRPLVVIDPESAVETNRLTLAYESMRDIQAALRSLVTAPRPEEPTGLGAVVEDAEGNVYTRTDRGALPWFTCYVGGNAGRCDWTRWDKINAVRVLSEGVTA